jgi:peptidoglycan/LPS O-acetylase OafA/YrhL
LPLTKAEFRSIIWIRAVAAWLVVWYHLCETFTRSHGLSVGYVEAVKLYLGDGLKIDTGIFGVTLFFIVSGFIITHVALQEGPLEFTVKRVLRIYPPLIFATLVYAAIWWTYQISTGEPLEAQPAPSWDAVVRSMIVFNGIFDGKWTINAVTWSLVLEVMFYTCTLALLPVLKRAPLVACILQMALFAAIVAWPISGYERLSLVTVSIACLFAAQVLYLGWSGHFDRRLMLVLLVAWWIIDQWAFRTRSANWFASNAVFVWHTLAFLIFGLLLALDDRLPVPKLVGTAADMSYSVFLLHVPVGFIVLVPLTPLIGFTPAIILALGAIIAASWCSYRTIERPSQRLARSLVASAPA